MTTEFIPMTVQVSVSDIEYDTSLQMRADDVDAEFAATLADHIREGAELPPCRLFRDEATGRYFIGDGWHRVAAYRIACGDKCTILAVVSPGGRAAAFAWAVGANADQQAKPRTRRDLRKAVIAAIREYMLGPSAAKNTHCVFENCKKPATQAQIAELCHTTQQTVSRILKELTASQQAAVAAAPEAPQRPVQQTFFDILERSFVGVMNHWSDVVDNPRWADPAIPVADKLAAVRDVKMNLKKMLKDIDQREAQLIKTKEG